MPCARRWKKPYRAPGPPSSPQSSPAPSARSCSRSALFLPRAPRHVLPNPSSSWLAPDHLLAQPPRTPLAFRAPSSLRLGGAALRLAVCLCRPDPQTVRTPCGWWSCSGRNRPGAAGADALLQSLQTLVDTVAPCGLSTRPSLSSPRLRQAASRCGATPTPSPCYRVPPLNCVPSAARPICLVASSGSQTAVPPLRPSLRTFCRRSPVQVSSALLPRRGHCGGPCTAS